MKGKTQPKPKSGESQEKYYARMMGTTPDKLMAGMKVPKGEMPAKGMMDRDDKTRRKPPGSKKTIKRGGK